MKLVTQTLKHHHGPLRTQAGAIKRTSARVASHWSVGQQTLTF